MKNKFLILNIHIYKPSENYIELLHPETRVRLLLSGRNKDVYLFLHDNEDLNVRELGQKIESEQFQFDKNEFDNTVSVLEKLKILRVEEVDEW